MRKTIVALALAGMTLSASAQKAYFADGFHGGVYGHYPMEWYTQFIVDQLALHPDWRIGLEIEPETWDSVMVRTPQAYQNFKRVAGGAQVEFTNPSYAQSYLYNISGESIIRQFYYGIRKVRQHFPDAQILTYSAEEPCFTSALPQVLHLFGFRHVVLKCPDTCWGGYTAAYGKELVNLIGPDGTSLLSVPRYACEALQPGSVWQTIAWRNSKEYLQACRKAGIKNPVGMCYQDAGWKYGPWLGGGDRQRNGSTYVRWTDYIEKYSVGKTKDNYHFSQDDVLPGLMWGSQVMQRVGQSVRHAENAIVQAEKIASMANMLNGFKPKQQDIDEAWRVLMLSQHHDSWICPYNNLNSSGTWSDNIVNVWTPKTLRIADATIDKALESMRGRDKSSETMLLRVFNTLGMERNEVVEVDMPQGFFVGKVLQDSKGNDVPFACHDGKLAFKANVPAFGYATYSFKAAKDNGRKPAAGGKGVVVDNGKCSMENDCCKLTFDLGKGGIVTSLYDKQNNIEYVENTDKYHFGELRGFFDRQQRFCSSVESGARATVVEDNDVRKVLRIDGTVNGTPFSQTYTLNAGDKKVDVDLTIDWNHNERIGDFRPRAKDDKRTEFYDTRYMLDVYFPTSVKQGKLYKNAPFDVCESKLEDTFFNRWDSLKHNVILNWVDVAGKADDKGFMLLSDHTTSYSFGKDFPLSLTAQYSGGGLWGRNYLITGPTHLHYAFVPHKGKWDKAGLSAVSDKWNEPLICKVVDNADVDSRSLVSVPEGYHLSAVLVDGSDILVRIFNEDGNAGAASFDINLPVKSVETVDLNGKTLGTASFTSNGGKSAVKMSMPRFGLTTFRVKI